MRKAISTLCGINERSYYVWKNKTHTKLINLLELYFTKEDIHEFIETNQISKMETLNHYEQTLNIEFNTFYRTYLDSYNKEYRIRFFWDFLTRYKEEISKIKFIDCKVSINELLLEYHLLLIDLCKNTYEHGSHLPTFYKFNEFMTSFQDLSSDMIFFIITGVKTNFKSHINYLLNHELYAYAIEVLACSTIDYFNDKAPTHKEVRGRLFLQIFQTIHKQHSKELYFELENYLSNYQDNKEEVVKLIESANVRMLL
jgi:hypothetical protein